MPLFENGFDTASWTWMEWAIIAASAFLLLIILLGLFARPAKKSKAVKTTEAKVTQPQTPASAAKPADSVKAAAAPEPKPAGEKSETSATTSAAPTPAKRKKPAKYHISQNKDDDSEHAGSWRVRKEGSEKTIKYFTTQKAAIEFAEQLAENQDSSIVIHKKDGSIRKQDYTKK